MAAPSRDTCSSVVSPLPGPPLSYSIDKQASGGAPLSDAASSAGGPWLGSTGLSSAALPRRGWTQGPPAAPQLAADPSDHSSSR